MMSLLALIVLGSLGLTCGCNPAPGAVNLAINGVASQSSDYLDRVMGYAEQAIDGSSDGDYYDGYCSHTQIETGAWWMVDLKQVYKITTVIISNRQDCCKDRLKGAEIRIGNSPDNNNPVCNIVMDTDHGSKILLCCNGMVGQYVSVVIPSRAEYLTLCEVEVYGEEIKQDPQVCW
ncbi:fucolectin-like [Pelodytes ibericus]